MISATTTIFALAYAHGFAGDRHFAFMHELGYVFVARVFRRRDRAAFERVTGDSRGWNQSSGSADDPNPPAEQVAQAYARCSYDPNGVEQPRDVSDSVFAYSGWNPTGAEHRQACTLFRRAAARQRLLAKLRRLHAG